MITVKFTLVTRARGIYGNAVESKEAEDDALCVFGVTAPLGLQREEAEDDALQVQYTSTQVHKYTSTLSKVSSLVNSPQQGTICAKSLDAHF
jgi:hypothetical protein